MGDKYILDFERAFKVRTRRNRLLEERVAGIIDRNDVEAYVNEVLDTGLASPGDASLIQKIVADLGAADQAVDEEFLREKMHELMYVAAEAIEQASDTGH